MSESRLPYSTVPKSPLDVPPAREAPAAPIGAVRRAGRVRSVWSDADQAGLVSLAETRGLPMTHPLLDGERECLG